MITGSTCIAFHCLSRWRDRIATVEQDTSAVGMSPDRAALLNRERTEARLRALDAKLEELRR